MADHAVIVADVDGVITYWSSGAEELLGYQAKDALGRHVDMVIPEHLRKDHWAGFHRAMLNARSSTRSVIRSKLSTSVTTGATLAVPGFHGSDPG